MSLPDDLRSKVLKSLSDAMRTPPWTTKDGGLLTSFERRTARLFGTRYAISTNNGTNALMAAASVLELKPGARVAVPAYGFYGMLAPFLFLGITPVFVPVDLCSLSANVQDYHRALEYEIDAILVFPPWGYPGQIVSIHEWATNNRLRSIGDLSHCHGGETGGRRLGAFTTISAASFGAGKLIDGGELGACMTNSPTLANRLVALGHPNRERRPWSPSESTNPVVSHSFGPKLRPHKAALAMALPQFDGFLNRMRHRRAVAMRMQTLAEDVGGLTAIAQGPETRAAWWRIVLVRAQGWDDNTRQHLIESGFPLDSIGYSDLLCDHPILRAPGAPKAILEALPPLWLNQARHSLNTLGYFKIPVEEPGWEEHWVGAMKAIRC